MLDEKVNGIDLFGEVIAPDVGRLSKKFLIPPFSVLDTRSGDWRKRKKMWDRVGLRGGVGRDAEAYTSNGALLKNGNKFYNGSSIGVSVFDPVLCEVMYSWFCPKNGSILDPFCGGPTRAFVAKQLDRAYTGIDVRKEQIDANINQIEPLICMDGITYICGDSTEDVKNLKNTFDMLIACPPYYDLEVYSDDTKDLSTMSVSDFDAAYQKILKSCVERLSNDSFACIVASNTRDCATGCYIDMCGKTNMIMQDCGASLYNELIVLNMFGNAPMRAGRYFNSRKVVRVHQNVMIYVKGDPLKASLKCRDGIA